MKKLSILTAVCFVLSFWAASASAYTWVDIAPSQDPTSPTYNGPYDALLDVLDDFKTYPGSDEEWLEEVVGGGVDLHYWFKHDVGGWLPYDVDDDWDYVVIKQSTSWFAIENTIEDNWVDPDPSGLLYSGAPPFNGGVYSHLTFYSGTPVPEPATMLLFGTGLIGLAGLRLRKKNK